MAIYASWERCTKPRAIGAEVSDFGQETRPVSFSWFWLFVAWAVVAVVYSFLNWPDPRPFSKGMESIGVLSSPLKFQGLIKAIFIHIVALLVLLSMLFGFLGAGIPVKLFKVGVSNSLDHLALRLAFGFGAVALVHQGLGLCGLFDGALMITLFVLFVSVGIGSFIQWLPFRKQETLGKDNAVPFVLSLILVASIFLVARTPVVDEDALSVHFAAPEHYGMLHKINAEPHQTWWHVSLGAEMLYQPFLTLGGVETAKLVTVAAVIALLFLVWRLGSMFRCGGISSWWPVFWAASCGVLAFWSVVVKYNTILAIFMTAALWCAVMGIRERKSWWYLAFWFLGLGYGVKITALFFIAGIIVALLYAGLFRMRLRWLDSTAKCNT